MIRILADSTADFTTGEARELGLTVVPLYVYFGEDQYRDGVDLPMDLFFEMLSKAKKLPTTSQPNPQDFIPAFTAAKENGDDLICILLSSGVSGTVQSAKIAKDEVGYDGIHIVDSLAATLAAKLLILRAYQRINEGYTVPQILADLDEGISTMRLLAVVDELKYFKMGGRLSSASALAGELLGIKPILTLEDGKLMPCGKARGLARAYDEIFEKINLVGGINEDWPVMLGYTGDISVLTDFEKACEGKLQNQPMKMHIGTCISTHAGPGARGIAFFANNANVSLL